MASQDKILIELRWRICWVGWFHRNRRRDIASGGRLGEPFLPKLFE